MRSKFHPRPQPEAPGRSEVLSYQFILGPPGPSVSAQMINCSPENNQTLHAPEGAARTRPGVALQCAPRARR